MTKEEVFLTLLKLVEKQTITAQQFVEMMAAIEVKDCPQPAEPTKITRKKTTQRHYTDADHLTIVQVAKLCNLNCKEAGRRLNIPPITVKGHIRYAGLIGCASLEEIERVKAWRRNHKMYLDLPEPVLATKVNLFGAPQ